MSQALWWVSLSPGLNQAQNGCLPCLLAARKRYTATLFLAVAPSLLCSPNMRLSSEPQRLPSLLFMCLLVCSPGDGKGSALPHVSLIFTNGDGTAMPLISYDTHGIANEFNTILITPCSVVAGSKP